MTTEEEIEKAFRKGLTPLHSQPSHGSPIPRKPKPDPGQTYFGRTHCGLVDEVEGAYLVGSEAEFHPPYAPSPIEWDTGNIEAPLGESVNSFEPCGTPAEVAASLPPDEEPSQ
jgi:hypothetical protein